MKKRKIKKIFKAVSLQLTFLLIIGTIGQSVIGAELNENNENTNNNYQSPLIQRVNKYRIWGKGEINYLFPKNLENFSGEKQEDKYSFRIDGYIYNTDIIVWNMYCWGIYSEWARLFALSLNSFRFYFRLIMPKTFAIVNYTGDIYCYYWTIPHGPAGTIYSLSGNASGIKRLY